MFHNYLFNPKIPKFILNFYLIQLYHFQYIYSMILLLLFQLKIFHIIINLFHFIF